VQYVTVTPDGGQPKCYGHCPADLTGKWRLTWHTGARNTVSLAQVNTIGEIAFFEGTYQADDGEKCLAVGYSQGSGDEGTANLRVSCKRMDLFLDGKLELEGSEIQGSYTAKAAATTTGAFKMSRSVCMLPEGCTKD